MKLKDIPASIPLEGIKVLVPSDVASRSKYPSQEAYLVDFWDRGLLAKLSPQDTKIYSLEFEELWQIFEIECLDYHIIQL